MQEKTPDPGKTSEMDKDRTSDLETCVGQTLITSLPMAVELDYFRKNDCRCITLNVCTRFLC